MAVSKYSMEIPNAGGSSNISEALSMEYMAQVIGAKRFIPEMEVLYWIEASMCDFIMTDGQGENVGVSVTRAVRYPFNIEFTLDDARFLLNKKLYKLMVARNSISEEQSFFKSILHIWCHSKTAADNLEVAHSELIQSDTEGTYENVHVICTVCDKQYIYTNRI
jgi:hypothetical protein